MRRKLIIDDIGSQIVNVDEIENQILDQKYRETITYSNSIQKLKDMIKDRLWSWMDDKAHNKGYHNSAQCSALVTSSVPSVKADAQAFNSWRDSVLVYINQVYQDVTNNVRTKPTLQELLDELPELMWP